MTRNASKTDMEIVQEARACDSRNRGGQTATGDEILFTNQVAEEYGFNAGTLRYWRHADQGPASFTMGPRGRVVYRRSEVERWIAEQERATRRGGGDAA